MYGLAGSESSTHLAIGLLAQDTGAGLLVCCEEAREQGEAVKDAFEEENCTFRLESVEPVASDLVDSVEQRKGVNGWLCWVSPVPAHHS